MRRSYYVPRLLVIAAELMALLAPMVADTILVMVVVVLVLAKE